MNERVSGKPSGLAGRLVIEGLLDADQASKAQAAAANERIPFVRYLVDEVKVDSHRLVEIASQEFGAPRFDITALWIRSFCRRDWWSPNLLQNTTPCPSTAAASACSSRSPIPPISPP
jgi:hypothetical protein